MDNNTELYAIRQQNEQSKFYPSDWFWTEIPSGTPVGTKENIRAWAESIAASDLEAEGPWSIERYTGGLHNTYTVSPDPDGVSDDGWLYNRSPDPHVV